MKKDIIIEGNCIDILPSLLEDSIDAIVTDPPAGISFMGKDWDKDKGGRNEWIAWLSGIASECLRVIKPGGHALVWALPRTSHWTGMAWEEAGWEPRDKIAHVFGSGFPKSLDISKKIDQMFPRMGMFDEFAKHFSECRKAKGLSQKEIAVNFPSKTGGLTGCVWNWENGAKRSPGFKNPASELGYHGGSSNKNLVDWDNTTGRFPSNLIWSHSPLCKRIDIKKVKGSQLDHVCSSEATNGIYHPRAAQRRHGYTDADGMETVEFWDCHPSCPSWDFAKAGNCGGGNHTYRRPKPAGRKGHIYGAYDQAEEETVIGKGDSGSASRFFKSCQFTEEDIPVFAYYAKASKSERGEGNNHPTVKSLSLMRYLVKLITPPNGLILDPFAGSGTTLLAAKQEGFHYIGIEKEHDYVEIANARIASSINSNSNNIIIKPKIELHKKSKTLFDF